MVAAISFALRPAIKNKRTSQPQANLRNPLPEFETTVFEQVRRIAHLNNFQTCENTGDLRVPGFEAHLHFLELQTERFSQFCDSPILNHLDIVDFLADDIGGFFQAEILKESQDDDVALVVGQLRIHCRDQRFHHDPFLDLRLGGGELPSVEPVHSNLKRGCVLAIAGPVHYEVIRGLIKIRTQIRARTFARGELFEQLGEHIANDIICQDRVMAQAEGVFVDGRSILVEDGGERFFVQFLSGFEQGNNVVHEKSSPISRALNMVTIDKDRLKAVINPFQISILL